MSNTKRELAKIAKEIRQIKAQLNKSAGSYHEAGTAMGYLKRGREISDNDYKAMLAMINAAINSGADIGDPMKDNVRKVFDAADSWFSSMLQDGYSEREIDSEINLAKKRIKKPEIEKFKARF